MDFSPAAISFTDDTEPSAPACQALLHHPTHSVDQVRELLAFCGASNWPVARIEGANGVWVTPVAGVSLEAFAYTLFQLGDEWELCAGSTSEQL